MPVYPRMRDFPEALVKILLTIMEKTPNGGATMEDLKEAYQETRGSTPSNKTIYRSIRRLNLIFNPLAYGETPEEVENEDKNGIADEGNDMEDFSPVIQSSRQKGETAISLTVNCQQAVSICQQCPPHGPWTIYTTA